MQSQYRQLAIAALILISYGPKNAYSNLHPDDEQCGDGIGLTRIPEFFPDYPAKDLLERFCGVLDETGGFTDFNLRRRTQHTLYA